MSISHQKKRVVAVAVTVGARQARVKRARPIFVYDPKTNEIVGTIASNAEYLAGLGKTIELGSVVPPAGPKDQLVCAGPTDVPCWEEPDNANRLCPALRVPSTNALGHHAIWDRAKRGVQWWRCRTCATRKMSSDPVWRKKNAEQLAKLNAAQAADPVWRKKNAEQLAKLNAAQAAKRKKAGP